MTRNHEKLLIATLAGIIIAGFAAFAIQPAFALQPTFSSTQINVLSAPTNDLLLRQLTPRA